MTRVRRARDLELGDIVAIPSGDASRLGVPYAEVLQSPRPHPCFAVPYVGLVGLVTVEIRAVGGNGEQMSCTWPARARLTLIRGQGARP
jgi:hypothetical protein